MKPVIEAAELAIKEEIESVQKLSVVASQSPYYKYACTTFSHMKAYMTGIMAFGRAMFRMSFSMSFYVDG